MDTQIDKLMNLLGCTEQEAQDIIRTDKLIDQDNSFNPFPLTAQQEKASKQARTVSTVSPYGKKTKRTAKTNQDKINIIQMLISGLNNVEKLNIENAERIFTFDFNGTKYKVTLSAPRK